jgi:hypothetical protein
MRQEKLAKWLPNAKPGTPVCYHTGELGVDRVGKDGHELDKTARLMAWAADNKLVVLFQKKSGANPAQTGTRLFQYWAVRTSVPWHIDVPTFGGTPGKVVMKDMPGLTDETPDPVEGVAADTYGCMRLPPVSEALTEKNYGGRQ